MVKDISGKYFRRKEIRFSLRFLVLICTLYRPLWVCIQYGLNNCVDIFLITNVVILEWNGRTSGGEQISGLDRIQNFIVEKYKLHIVDCPEWRKEQSNYRYRTINGFTLDQPVDEYNHLWDAARYAVMSNLRGWTTNARRLTILSAHHVGISGPAVQSYSFVNSVQFILNYAAFQYYRGLL
jgi:hypothetical protein